VKSRRRSGLLVPLFSLTSTRSWGVGEFQDLPVFAAWAAASGQSFVQILPITEIPEAETSPYSSLTAMALDPIYITLPSLEDFQALGGEGALPADEAAALAFVRAAPRVEHREVRALKRRQLRRAFERFMVSDVAKGSARAQRFVAFMRDEDPWLDDYALFQALRTAQALRPWWEWPEPLARRQAEALQSAHQHHRNEIYFRKYVQWVAAEQWADARRQAQPLQIYGDLPFMISADSPDVWTQQHEFRFDGSVGVPPDAFSDTGQDWGLPPWRWEVMAENDYRWMRRRARRSATLYDGFRLDHLVGLYRTYIRPYDKSQPPYFAPPDERTQARLGEALVGIYQDSGAEIIAEDLGTVPDFVRQSLQRLGVPGFKVMRWERQWQRPGQPYIDPSEYPETSVATTGTHDTEPLALWWDNLSAQERREAEKVPAVQRYLSLGLSQLDAMLRALLESRSRLTIIPVQDLFGWRDRINTPAQVSDGNWTWRLPWRVDHLREIPEARTRGDALAEWTREANRPPAKTSV